MIMRTQVIQAITMMGLELMFQPIVEIHDSILSNRTISKLHLTVILHGILLVEADSDSINLSNIGLNGDTIMIRFVAINDYGNRFYG